jgi:rRNA small subunit pseudouridine methyltransferase Nep1
MNEVREPRLAKTLEEKETMPRLIVILEGANLETIKRGNKFELLNADSHARALKRHDRDLNDARPDIVHQCLLHLLDSPLNKAGKLQVYVHTKRNVLIEINPQTRIPRTFRRFAGLMVQLLHKRSIRAVDGPKHLLRVIKNPATSHLPTGAPKIGLSSTAKLVDVDQFVGKLDADRPYVFVIGAFAHGKIDADYIEEEIGISSFPLSGALCCSKVCSAFEKLYEIL